MSEEQLDHKEEKKKECPNYYSSKKNLKIASIILIISLAVLAVFWNIESYLELGFIICIFPLVAFCFSFVGFADAVRSHSDKENHSSNYLPVLIGNILILCLALFMSFKIFVDFLTAMSDT